MRITIIIDTDNAAFEDYPMRETGRILAHLANDMHDAGNDAETFDGRKLRDINGNTCGKVTISDHGSCPGDY